MAEEDRQKPGRPVPPPPARPQPPTAEDEVSLDDATQTGGAEDTDVLPALGQARPRTTGGQTGAPVGPNWRDMLKDSLRKERQAQPAPRRGPSRWKILAGVAIFIALAFLAWLLFRWAAPS